jgi:sigma-B regulation protein RsbU (phosphoserine phosphatase)
MNDERDTQTDRNSLKLERLELALRASNEGIWDWWTDQKEIFYSRRILEFIECGKDRAPNLFIAPHHGIHPEESSAFSRAVSQALQDSGPETLAVDARGRTGGGDWRWLRIRGTVVRDRTGKAIRIAGSMINISRRKDAEAQVEDERFLLRQLIDNVPLQIYFKDVESRFVMANHGMATWMELTKESDLTGKHDRDFFDNEHWMPAHKDEMRIMETGTPILDQLEHEMWHEGAETWVITSKFPWRDRHGFIKGTFGVSSDVTKLIKAQRETSQLAQQLQEKNLAYEEELHLAREIQQALAGDGFPATSSANDHTITFGARYIPISGLAGDFFEVMQVRDDCVAVLICDVMGHGVRSALIVAMLRGLLEKQRAQVNDPGLFLQGLNDGLAAILERAGTTMFATAFFGLIDLTSGSLKYACAGHPGPIIAGKNGVQQLATQRSEKGPGLGLIRGAPYPTCEVDFKEVDRMILFTDGVLEAENLNGEPFFEKRLIELITHSADAPINHLLDGILSSVLAFSESQHFDDDVCLLGLEVIRRPAE